MVTKFIIMKISTACVAEIPLTVWAGIMYSGSLKVCSRAGTKGKMLTLARSPEQQAIPEIDGASWVTESIFLLLEELWCKIPLINPWVPLPLLKPQGCSFPGMQLPKGAFPGSCEGAGSSPAPFAFPVVQPFTLFDCSMAESTSTCVNNFNLC